MGLFPLGRLEGSSTHSSPVSQTVAGKTSALNRACTLMHIAMESKSISLQDHSGLEKGKDELPSGQAGGRLKKEIGRKTLRILRPSTSLLCAQLLSDQKGDCQSRRGQDHFPPHQSPKAEPICFGKPRPHTGHSQADRSPSAQSPPLGMQ